VKVRGHLEGLHVNGRKVRVKRDPKEIINEGVEWIKRGSG